MFFALLFVINLGISACNAWVVGRSWADVKAIGSLWQKILLGCAFIMSGCGFTWCYLIVFALAASWFGWLDSGTVGTMLDLGYVALLLPVLGSGLALWIDSVTTAFRRRDLGSIGTAAWNTYAMAHNTYMAATSLPDILKGLTEFFTGGKDSDRDLDAQGLVIILVILGIALGFITSYAIVRMSASAYSSRVMRDMWSRPTY